MIPEIKASAVLSVRDVHIATRRSVSEPDVYKSQTVMGSTMELPETTYHTGASGVVAVHCDIGCFIEHPF
mgnify:CR=1 FL=1